MEKDYLKEEKYYDAVERVKKIKGFYTHLIIYIIINSFISLMVLFSNDFNFHFGVVSTWIFWGIGLVAHAAGVFGNNLIFSKDWENRKIQEILEEEEREDNQVKF